MSDVRTAEAKRNRRRLRRAGRKRCPTGEETSAPSLEASAQLLPGAPQTVRDVMALQRAVGNGAVQRLIGTETLVAGGPQAMAAATARLRHPSVVSIQRNHLPTSQGNAVQRSPGPEESAASAEQLLEAKAPLMLKVLTADQIAQVQQAIDARHRAAKLQAERGRIHVHEEPDLEPSGPTEDIAARKRLAARASRQEGRADALALTVPTEQLLAPDFLATNEGPRLTALREQIYKQLITYPTRLVLRPGPALDPRSPSPLFTLSWGPKNHSLGHDRCRVTFDHVAYDTNLMDEFTPVPAFAEAYRQAIHQDVGEMAASLAEHEREYGGKFYPLWDKKVGEIYGKIYNDDVRVADEAGNFFGYPDDQRGRSDVGRVVGQVKGSVMVAAAPDGRLHVYTLKPGFDRWRLTSPDNDLYVYLLDKGRQVPDVRQIRTSDHFVLERGATRKGAGWRCEEDPAAPSNVEKGAMGAFFGDIAEDYASAGSTAGQVGAGFIPIYGQLADVRDIAYGTYKMISSGGKEGKLQTAAALAGLLPGLDFLKGSKGARRGAREAVEQAEALAQEGLGREIAQNAAGFLERVPGLRGELATLPGLARAAAAGTPAAAQALTQKVRALMALFNGDAGAVVAAAGGSWRRVAQGLKGAGAAGEAVGASMEGWRVAMLNGLKREMAEEAQALARTFGRKVEAPDLFRTGTHGFGSDLDFSCLGPNAIVHRNAVIRKLEQKFGANWSQMLDANVFADPTRLHLFAGIGGAAGARAEKALVGESGLNMLAASWREGKNLEEVKRLAQSMGLDMKKVLERKRELDRLAEDFEKVGSLKDQLRKNERRLSKETDASARDALERQRNELQARIETAEAASAYRQLELKMDALHERFLRADSKAEKATIAQEMASTQAKLNVVNPEAYATPGGGGKWVTNRDPGLAARTGAAVTVSPAMAYQSFLDQRRMLEHVMAKVVRGRFDTSTVKGLKKYTERLASDAFRHGIDYSRARRAEGLLAQIIMDLERMKGAAGTYAEMAARFDGYCKEAQSLVQDTLTELIGAQSASAQRYLAASLEAGKIEDLIAKATEELRLQALIWTRFRPMYVPRGSSEKQ